MPSCFLLAWALGWLYKEMETECAIKFPSSFLLGKGMLGIAERLVGRDSLGSNIKNEDIIFLIEYEPCCTSDFYNDLETSPMAL